MPPTLEQLAQWLGIHSAFDYEIWWLWIDHHARNEVPAEHIQLSLMKWRECDLLIDPSTIATVIEAYAL